MNEVIFITFSTIYNFRDTSLINENQIRWEKFRIRWTSSRESWLEISVRNVYRDGRAIHDIQIVSVVEMFYIVCFTYVICTKRK